MSPSKSKDDDSRNQEAEPTSSLPKQQQPLPSYPFHRLLIPAIIFILTVVLLPYYFPTQQYSPLQQYIDNRNMAASIPASLPRTVFNRTLYNRIQTLWFSNNDTAPDKPTYERWFGLVPEKKVAFDAECRSVGLAALKELGPSTYPLPPFQDHKADRLDAARLSAPLRDLIKKAPEEQEEPYTVGLSLILLLDQLPRNIFREASEQGIIYSHYDRLARTLSYSIAQPGSDIADLDLSPAWRMNPTRRLWWYLPLMHSESLEDHDLLVSRTTPLRDELQATRDEPALKYTMQSLNYEERHSAILRQFGRYCHRNGPLGRETTAEEKQYLEGGGDTFGTKTA
ncbi:MAG: hypothetical protein M1828_002447 [Chrysothrix sp. TS-e1954]|nr:MAG: hypothetical protein M1828_002447 [Chrysothrix sp. TS-e1954]